MSDDKAMAETFRQTLWRLYKLVKDREHAHAEYLIDKLVTDMQVLEAAAAENVVKAVANANHAAVKESAELRDALKEIATLDYENADCWTGRSAIEMARTALRIKRV